MSSAKFKRQVVSVLVPAVRTDPYTVVFGEINFLHNYLAFATPSSDTFGLPGMVQSLGGDRGVMVYLLLLSVLFNVLAIGFKSVNEWMIPFTLYFCFYLTSNL